jgi:hypothetical protein
MPHRGESRQIIDHRIVAAISSLQQSFKPSLPIPVIIPVQIIPAHLVDDDAYHQFGAGYPGGMSGPAGRKNQDGQEKKAEKLLIHEGKNLGTKVLELLHPRVKRSLTYSPDDSKKRR